MTSTAYDDQFAVCTPEEEEAFKAIEARQQERASGSAISGLRERFEAWAKSKNYMLAESIIPDDGMTYRYSTTEAAWRGYQAALPWTNVEDGLPDNGDPVIANDGHDSYCAMYAGRWLDLEITDRDGDNWPLDNVKRWMPLPE